MQSYSSFVTSLKLNFIKNTFLLLSFFFCSPLLFAQYTSLKGTVVDAHTKEPVAFASVYFKKSVIGKTTDTAGNFSFNVSSGILDTLIVTYVGYQTFKMPVQLSEGLKTMKIELERGGLNNEVIIKAKFNKGLYLWKKIMSKKKQYNRYNLPNFGYEAYNKLEVDIKNFKADKVKKNFLLKPFAFVLDNIDSTSEKDPFLPAYLLESVSDYSFQKSPKKFTENIKASNTKGFSNESISKMLGVMNQNVNIYGNYVNVMDKDFVSPFNDNADLYYSFSVPDTQIINGKKAYHFLFRPKRSGQNTFEGDAFVMEKTFQIQKISLYLGKDANVNFIDRISVFQEFIPLNDTVYFLNRDKFFADFKVLGKQSLTLIGRKTTSYKNIIINSDSITAIFKEQPQEEVVTTVAGGNKYSDSAWGQLRHDTLSLNEKAIYTTIDKLLQMPKFQKMQRRLKFLGTGYTEQGKFELGPWFNWVSSNSWEGTRFRFDLGSNTTFNKKLYLHGYLAYGTKDKAVKGKAEAYYIFKRDPKWAGMHISHSKDIDNGISQVGDVSQDNIFSLAIRKPNITRKFLQLQETRFEIFDELWRGFSTQLFVAHRTFRSLQNLPFETNVNGAPITNFEVALKFRFAYLEQFFQSDYFRHSLGSKYPVAELMLARGIPGVFGSAYTYSKVSASVKDFMKISPFGSISYKAYAGKIFGTVPFPFLENHPGNDIYYYNSSSFNLMNRFEYLSDQYAGINFEHNVGSGIFRFVKLTRKLKWRQFYNIKTLWGSLSDANANLNNAGKNFKTLNGKTYMEAGTGIDNIFKVFRLDFIWRLTPTQANLPKTANFGVFGSFQFQF